MVRDKCFKKLYFIGEVSCPVSRGCCFCVSSNMDRLYHVFCLGGTYVLSSPWTEWFSCSWDFCVMQSACMCLPGTAAMLSQPPSASLGSLFLPHWRRGWERIEGELSCVVLSGTWIYSISATKRNLFVSFPFSTLADLGKSKAFLNVPQCS